ncbi:MAG: Ig-like domain-containing protein [Anaerohalosphaeraceae bacterium]
MSALIFLLAAGTVYSDLIWSDEFDGPAIDKNVWTYDIGGGGWGNGELQYYTSRPENAYIEDGKLVIQALRESYGGRQFTSARLLTQGRFAFKYGTLEARIKMPDIADGLWPAFWLLGNNFGPIDWPDCGETDIVELGSRSALDAGLANRRLNAAAHWDYNGNYASHAVFTDAPVNLNEDYHLYKLSWTPTMMRAYLDGVEFWSLDISNPEASFLQEFHQSAFVVMNLAIGGWNYVKINEPAEITASFPARMYVDWLRLYSNPSTEIVLSEDSEESGTFGVFTETTPVTKSLTYGTNAKLLIWNNMTAVTTTPFEGSQAWSFDIAAGTWFGAGVWCSENHNMKNYSDGTLRLHMKTTSTTPIKIGLKSAVASEFWLPLVNGGEQFGLVRDGNWHQVSIPLNRFADIDFQTVHQMLMIAGDPPASSFNLSIDNVYWEENAPRPMPANGSFGIYTQTASHKTADEFVLGTDGDFFIWESTMVPRPQTPFEGTACISLQSATAMTWFGAAFTPNVKYNLTAFRYPESRLHAAIKTSSTVTFQIGMKSGNSEGIGQKWITFKNGSDPYGFIRDGNWHEIEIPMADFMDSVDLSQVSQFFELLGTSGPVTDIQLDDICFTNGGEPLIEDGLLPTVSITSPTDGQFFSIGDTITIETDASAAKGSIAGVKFFEGANLLGEDLTAPYSYTWADAAGGSHLITAKATDSNGLTRSASIRIYVGEPILTTLVVSPSSTKVEVGQTQSFTAAGYNQFGLPFAVTPAWSVDGGGSIDSSGLFSAFIPGSNFTVTAQAGSLSASATVSVTKPAGTCTGGPANGEYTYAVSGDSQNPTMTFIPGYTGVGNNLVILYYGTNPTGVYPGYITSPNTPYQISAPQGQTIYFYYTYSVPQGGEHNTSNDRHSVTVGNCSVTVQGDINGDGIVDMADLSMLAYYWLDITCEAGNDFCYGADTQPDGIVNLLDLAGIARFWLN